MKRFRPALAATLFFALATPLAASSFGPFFLREETPPLTRTAWAGPFAEHVRDAGSGETIDAWLRPFFATAYHPGTALAERSEWDALWPVAQGKRYAGEDSWRFLLAYRRARLDGTASRFLVLPLWVHGLEKEEGYAGMFPFWGDIPHFLFADRFEWRFWPVWMRTTVSDATTTVWFWPFVAKTDTPDGHLSKRRVFPFYMRHDRAGEFSKRSILWPFWSEADYFYPSEKGRAWIFFPVAGHVETTKQNEWMALPPVVRWGTSDRGSLVQVWPFYRRVTGWREETTLWPLFSERRDASGIRGYALWPLYWYGKHYAGAQKTTRFILAPVFSQHTLLRRAPLPEGERAAIRKAKRAAREAARAEGRHPDDAEIAEAERQALESGGTYEPVARRTAVWPLFTWEWDETGERKSRFRTLDLWPGNDPAPVARSWAPLWTLFDSRREGKRERTEALWGIYRASADEGTGESAREIFPLWNRRTGARDESFGWSVGKGLVAYDRFEDGTKRFRFLWLGRWTWGGDAE
jgi:hypothetical protein